ncbi:sensor domain-containing diguanylate cyclase [Pleomorphomonas oryzae]|uniref:sensor domain-containing diguanylate cyclase n=1 Tax=Pleomorphomonas oryzae TaxID=261934 RepID=UPI00041F29F8|nr:diguanylate cyclase [Pleomorphomonas oryzae]
MRIRLIVLAVIALCLTPFLVVQLLGAHKERAASIQRVEQSLQVSIDRIRDLLDGTQADIENISANISISSAYQNTSPESCRNRLRRVASLYDSVAHVSILTPEAIVFCSSIAGAEGVRASHDGKLVRSRHNNDTLWGETQVSGISNTLVIPSMTAIRNDLGIDYMIVASIAASTMLSKALDLFDVPLSEAAIVDGQGKVVTSEQFSTSESIIGANLIRRSLDMPSGVFAENMSEKDAYYVGVVKFPMNNSRLIFLSPLKEEYDRAKNRLKGAIILALVEVFILAALMMFSAEFFFVRNLRRIGAFATEITAGNQDRRISVKSPLAEFNALVAALNLMVDKLEDTSRQDALTGIANRRALDAHLTHCDQQLAAGKGPFAVAMLDIDNFKLFNDRFGHAAGDKTLQRVGEALRRFTKRQGEMAARYGGEEFTLVLNDCDPERLLDHLEVIRRAVEDLDIPHPDSPYGRVTVSLGYTVASAGTTMHQAIERADAALYRSKANGRNRISADDAPELSAA